QQHGQARAPQEDANRSGAGVLQEAQGWRECNGDGGAAFWVLYATVDVSPQTCAAAAIGSVAGYRAGESRPGLRALPAQPGLSGHRRAGPPPEGPGDRPGRPVADRPDPG